MTEGEPRLRFFGPEGLTDDPHYYDRTGMSQDEFDQSVIEMLASDDPNLRMTGRFVDQVVRPGITLLNEASTGTEAIAGLLSAVGTLMHHACLMRGKMPRDAFLKMLAMLAMGAKQLPETRTRKETK